jgi:hypothetical protein
MDGLLDSGDVDQPVAASPRSGRLLDGRHDPGDVLIPGQDLELGHVHVPLGQLQRIQEVLRPRISPDRLDVDHRHIRDPGALQSANHPIDHINPHIGLDLFHFSSPCSVYAVPSLYPLGPYRISTTVPSNPRSIPLSL